jgi:hypothetical protein
LRLNRQDYVFGWGVEGFGSNEKVYGVTMMIFVEG